MRVVRRSLVALVVVGALAGSSAMAAPRDDSDRGRHVTKKSTLPAFVQRILDYLDNKLTVPPF